MSDQPPPPPLGGPGGYQPPNPTQPFPPQGGPPPGGYGGQPPGGYGGQPPGGYGGQPPGGYGGQPPGGYGGAPPPGSPPPGGYGGFQSPPKKSKAPLIVGIVAAVVILAGAVGGFLFFGGDDDDDVVVQATPTPVAPLVSSSTPPPTAGPEPTVAPATETPPTGGPNPAGTMPAAPPDAPGPGTAPATPAPPTGQPPPPADPPPPPPPPAGGGQAMTMNEAVAGDITTADEAREFFFDGESGEEVLLTLIGIGGTLDPVLTIFAPDGTELARNDDARSEDLPSVRDSQIQTALPTTGEYRVEASGFAGSTGPFELTLDFPSVLSASDAISESTQEIGYDYVGTAGQRIVINVRSLDDMMDPVVFVEDPAGNEIGRNDDGGDDLDSLLELTIPADGTYTVVVTSFGTRYGEYTITLAEL